MLFNNKLVFCETTVGYPSDSLASCFLYFYDRMSEDAWRAERMEKSIIRSRLDCMPQLRTGLLLERFLPPSTRIYYVNNLIVRCSRVVIFYEWDCVPMGVWSLQGPIRAREIIYNVNNLYRSSIDQSTARSCRIAV